MGNGTDILKQSVNVGFVIRLGIEIGAFIILMVGAWSLIKADIQAVQIHTGQENIHRGLEKLEEDFVRTNVMTLQLQLLNAGITNIGDDVKEINERLGRMEIKIDNYQSR